MTRTRRAVIHRHREHRTASSIKRVRVKNYGGLHPSTNAAVSWDDFFLTLHIGRKRRRFGLTILSRANLIDDIGLIERDLAKPEEYTLNGIDIDRRELARLRGILDTVTNHGIPVIEGEPGIENIYVPEHLLDIAVVESVLEYYLRHVHDVAGDIRFVWARRDGFPMTPVSFVASPPGDERPRGDLVLERAS